MVFALAAATAISNVIAWMNRIQLAATKLESQAQLSAMELRLSEKIQGAYTSWQAHNDLSKRVERMEHECAVCMRAGVGG